MVKSLLKTIGRGVLLSGAVLALVLPVPSVSRAEGDVLWRVDVRAPIDSGATLSADRSNVATAQASTTRAASTEAPPAPPLEWFQEEPGPGGESGVSSRPVREDDSPVEDVRPVASPSESRSPAAIAPGATASGARVSGAPVSGSAASGAAASGAAMAAGSGLTGGWGHAIPMVRLTGGDHNVLRRGPGDEFAIVAVEPKGSEYRVLAKKEEWYSVAISETTSGWIHSALCEEFEDLSHLEMRPNPRLFSRTGAFTLTGYAGGYAYDRKSNSVALGGRVGYYVFDFVEVEGGVSWTHIHRPAEVVESLFNLRLEAEDFHMLYYNLGLRLELLPGRQMVPYLVGGAGAAILRGRTESAWNYGGGTTLFLTKTTATRWELRSYRFDAGFDRARRTNHNIEFSFGTSVLF